MNREEKGKYARSPITTPEQLYALTRETVANGELICVITDLDDTVLVGMDPEHGFSAGDDPRRVEILPAAAQAFQEIAELGGRVGVITNRGGRDAANYLRRSGVSQAHIIGTYGWERYVMNTSDPEKDDIRIDDRFIKHASSITKSLRILRERVHEALGEATATDGANIIIPTKRNGETLREQAPLIIQQKGVSSTDGFPFGLANIYNFNLMPLGTGVREKLRSILESSYTSIDVLKESWGMGGDSTNPEEVQRFTRGFEPLIKEGKAHAMVEMIRDIEAAEMKKDNGKKIGLVVFSGDSNADAEAMKAARLLESFRNGKMRSVGIWVSGNSEQSNISKRSDIQLADPAANALLLQGIAQNLK